MKTPALAAATPPNASERRQERIPPMCPAPRAEPLVSNCTEETRAFQHAGSRADPARLIAESLSVELERRRKQVSSCRSGFGWVS
jgi:hypothetical protein